MSCDIEPGTPEDEIRRLQQLGRLVRRDAEQVSESLAQDDFSASLPPIPAQQSHAMLLIKFTLEAQALGLKVVEIKDRWEDQVVQFTGTCDILRLVVTPDEPPLGVIVGIPEGEMLHGELEKLIDAHPPLRFEHEPFFIHKKEPWKIAPKLSLFNELAGIVGTGASPFIRNVHNMATLTARYGTCHSGREPIKPLSKRQLAKKRGKKR